LTAPFTWWAASSIVGFIVVLLLAPARGIAWLVRRRSPPESASRRHFLERTGAQDVSSSGEASSEKGDKDPVRQVA
jgi:hypothetical protein